MPAPKNWLVSSLFDRKPTLQRTPSMGGALNNPLERNKSSSNLSPIKSKYMATPGLKQTSSTNSLTQLATSAATPSNNPPKAKETPSSNKVTPPPPKNSPLTLNHKSRKPPIFSVPFKGTNS